MFSVSWELERRKCYLHTDRYFTSENPGRGSLRSHISFSILPPSSAIRQIDIWKSLKLGTAARGRRPRAPALSARNTILLKTVYFYGTLLLTLRYKIISLRLAHIIRASDSWQHQFAVCSRQALPGTESAQEQNKVFLPQPAGRRGKRLSGSVGYAGLKKVSVFSSHSG